MGASQNLDLRDNIVSSQVLQWDQTTPWSSLTPPTTESRYLTSMDRTGEMKVVDLDINVEQVLVGRLRQWGGRV